MTFLHRLSCPSCALGSALAVFAVAWLLIAGPVHLPERLRQEGEHLAQRRLLAAGFPWARLEIHGEVGRLIGQAPSESAHTQLMASAPAHLSALLGWGGLVRSFEDGVRVQPAAFGGERLSLRLKAQDLAPPDEAAPTVPPAPVATPSPSPVVPAAVSGGCAPRLEQLQSDDALRFESGTARWAAPAGPALDALAAQFQACGTNAGVAVHAAGEGRLGSPHRRELIEARARTVIEALEQRGVRGLRVADLDAQARVSGPGRARARGVAFEWNEGR